MKRLFALTALSAAALTLTLSLAACDQPAEKTR